MFIYESLPTNTKHRLLTHRNRSNRLKGCQYQTMDCYLNIVIPQANIYICVCKSSYWCLYFTDQTGTVRCIDLWVIWIMVLVPHWDIAYNVCCCVLLLFTLAVDSFQTKINVNMATTMLPMTMSEQARPFITSQVNYNIIIYDTPKVCMLHAEVHCTMVTTGYCPHK